MCYTIHMIERKQTNLDREERKILENEELY